MVQERHQHFSRTTESTLSSAYLADHHFKIAGCNRVSYLQLGNIFAVSNSRGPRTTATNKIAFLHFSIRHSERLQRGIITIAPYTLPVHLVFIFFTGL